MLPSFRDDEKLRLAGARMNQNLQCLWTDVLIGGSERTQIL